MSFWNGFAFSPRGMAQHRVAFVTFGTMRVFMSIVALLSGSFSSLLFFRAFSLLFVSFLVSTTCQVGHFDSHTFWFLIEFFIENLVLTGGRYKRMNFVYKYFAVVRTTLSFFEVLNIGQHKVVNFRT